jgi:hypothetical protein
MRPLGLLEAFGLAEEVGTRALTFDELLFMADARKRKGCRLIGRLLKAEEIQRVLELGRKCAVYKELPR